MAKKVEELDIPLVQEVGGKESSPVKSFVKENLFDATVVAEKKNFEQKETVEKKSDSLLKDFLENSKFMKSFQNMNLDKRTVKQNVFLIESNNIMVDTLAGVLKVPLGTTKGELVNLIIASFFKKYASEIKEAHRLSILETESVFDI